jgi:hypothetical protein
LLPRPPRGSPCTAPRLRRPRRCWVCAPPDQRRRGAPTQARWLGRRRHRARPVGASALRCQLVEGSGKQRVASAVKPSGSCRHGARKSAFKRSNRLIIGALGESGGVTWGGPRLDRNEKGAAVATGSS